MAIIKSRGRPAVGSLMGGYKKYKIRKRKYLVVLLSICCLLPAKAIFRLPMQYRLLEPLFPYFLRFCCTPLRTHESVSRE